MRPLFPILVSAVLLPCGVAAGDILTNNDGIIRSNLCVGLGCADAEFYSGFASTIRLRDSTVVMDFVDTTTNGLSPSMDWQFIFNSDLAFNNGGTDRFVLRSFLQPGQADPFVVAGGAPTNALYVAADGDIGLGTAIPQSPLHVETTSNSGLRLSRSNTVFGSQAWESAILLDGSFAIADASNANFPFLVSPTSPQGALFLSEDGITLNSTNEDYFFDVRATGGSALFADPETGDIGMGTLNPITPLHLLRASTNTAADFAAGILIEDTGTVAPRGLLTLRNQGQVFFSLEDTNIPAGANTGRAWNFQNLGGEFRVTTAPGGGDDIEMRLDVDGNMRIEGNYFANSFTQMMVPDYVFEPDYALRPLSDVASFVAEHKHLPEVPSAAEIVAEGVNMNEMQMTLLKKIEELTLYALEQEAARHAQADKIASQTQVIAGLEALLAAQTDRLARIEAALAAR